jgi:glutathione S-transferase
MPKIRTLPGSGCIECSVDQMVRLMTGLPCKSSPTVGSCVDWHVPARAIERKLKTSINYDACIRLTSSDRDHMNETTPLAFYGLPGSPYTQKMLALLRYRRIPYRFLYGDAAELAALPKPRVALLPTFYLRDETGALEAVVDSTPLIRRLEQSYTGRSVMPGDPVVAFVDYLIEDFADEWLTKAMFHYRWHYADDIEKAADILPRWTAISASNSEIATRGKNFSERQISRLYVVGSNETTTPLIEAGYLRLLKILDKHLGQLPFLLGKRPGAADFALYGQLTALAKFDPTPMALTLKNAPRVYAWVDLVSDLSGHEPADGDWIDRGQIRDLLRPLLCELGKGYVPVMLANAQALMNGADVVEAKVDGSDWSQKPFPYQAKCLNWLNELFDSLDDDEQNLVRHILDGTGCDALLQ